MSGCAGAGAAAAAADDDDDDDEEEEEEEPGPDKTVHPSPLLLNPLSVPASMSNTGHGPSASTHSGAPFEALVV